MQDARVVSGCGRRVDAGTVEATLASAVAGAYAERGDRLVDPVPGLPAPSVELATTRIARGQATFGPVPLHNLASAVDLQVRERSGSGTIVGRVVSTPLSDRGVRVPVAGGCCVQQVRATAQAELEGAPPPNQLTDAEVYAMIDSLGDVGTALADATRRA